MDGYDPDLREGELHHSGPAVGRIRSVELAEILGLNSREMARALEGVGAGSRQHRFPALTRTFRKDDRAMPVVTTGYTRDQFRVALAWLVELR